MNDISVLNRKLKERVEFKKDGDFQSLYSAQEYLNKNGFVWCHFVEIYLLQL